MNSLLSCIKLIRKLENKTQKDTKHTVMLLYMYLYLLLYVLTIEFIPLRDAKSEHLLLLLCGYYKHCTLSKGQDDNNHCWAIEHTGHSW